MKKSVIFVAVTCAVMSLAALGCSKKEGGTSASSSAASGKGITLTVWESLDGPDAFIREAAAAYTKQHPNVKIRYVNVELGDAAGQIALDGPGGVGPDVFAAPHDKLGELVNGGHVLATVDADSVKKSVLASCAQALTYGGTMYGYPVSAETYALFYNKALIAENEVPSSWEALSSWVKNFNSANPGKYGFVMDVGNGYYTIVFTTANGNRLFGESGTDTEHTNINTPVAVNGMKFFQTLRSALNVPAADLNTATSDAAFQSGNAAMHITGLWNVKPFEDAGIDFGVAPLPSLPGDSTPASSFSGTRAMFVSAYTDHPEEANDFARFLTTPEMQRLRFEITGAMPSVEIEVNSKYMPGFLAQLEYAFPMPSIPAMGSYWEAMANASKNIWDGANVQKELDACNQAILGK